MRAARITRITFGFIHLQNVDVYTHYIPYLYLPMNAFLRFRYWQLKVSFLAARYATFLIVSFFSKSLFLFLPLFAGVCVDKLAIDEDKLEIFTFDIFL